MTRYCVFLLIAIPVMVKAQFNWQVILPELIGDVQFHYTSLTCVGQKCFIVGNTFDRDAARYQQFFMLSDNGGDTWDSIHFGQSKILLPFLTKIFALDTMRIYAVGDSGYFTNSIDGGRTWSPLRRIWEAHRYTDISFVDSLHGFIVGGSGVILTTSDGGKEWSFNQTHRGWILTNCIGFKGGKYLAFDKYGGRIFQSYDYGTTWDTIFAYNPYVGDDFQLFLNDIYFTDTLNGFICGTRSPQSGWYFPWIIHTSDGGKSWTSIIDTSTENVLDLFSMCYVTPEKGVAIGRLRTYLVTNDGGKTWSADSVDSPSPFWSFMDNAVRVADGAILATAGDAVSNYLIRGTQKPLTVPDISKQNSKLFPNPVVNKLFFDLPVTNQDRLFLYDITGRQIKQISSEEKNRLEIDCSQLPAGMYWLTHNRNATKFIKQ